MYKIYDTIVSLILPNLVNASIFISNLTIYKDLGIKIINEEVTDFCKRFFTQLENCQNPLLKEHIHQEILVSGL